MIVTLYIVLGIIFLYICLILLFFNALFDRHAVLRFPPFGRHTPAKQIIESGKTWMNSHPHQILNVVNDEGLRLVAHYFTCENADRILLMVHGWRGSWDYEFAPFAKWFFEHNCNLLIVEQRGQGSSGGNHLYMGLKEANDVVTWVNAVRPLNERCLPLYLFGMSMGCTSVLRALPMLSSKHITGIIADCGYTNPYRVIRRFAWERFHIPEHPVLDSVRHMGIRRLGIDLKDTPTDIVIANCTTPILFIHGENDRFAPYEDTVRMHLKYSGPKAFLSVPNAGHCMSYIVDPEVYTNTVYRFFMSTENNDSL